MKLLAIVAFLILFLQLATAASAAAEWVFTGKVVGVTDGDTLLVMHQGVAEKIRLAGVDCPEIGQEYGSRAKKFTADLVFGKKVKVLVKGKDKSGKRVVAEVLLQQGDNLGHELVRAGLAWWYRYYSPNDAVLKALERQAKAERRGLWSLESPIAPRDFRKQKQGCGCGKNKKTQKNPATKSAANNFWGRLLGR